MGVETGTETTTNRLRQKDRGKGRQTETKKDRQIGRLRQKETKRQIMTKKDKEKRQR